MNNNINTYTLFSRPYLDLYNQCYKNIITINFFPKGPLGKFVRKVQFNRLSPFKQSGPCSHINNCGLAITGNIGNCVSGGCNNGSNLLTVNDVPNLMSFLLSNGYSIDTSLTKMFNQSNLKFNTENADELIFIISYNG